jgi:predicted GIY-YIG superfamily endonuclease
MTIPCDADLQYSGIYLIRNDVNNKVYIGQSNCIDRRWKEHLRSGQPEKYHCKNERDVKTPIHLAM